MRLRFPSRSKSVLLGLLFMGGVAFFAHTAFAQVSLGFPGSFIGLGSQDLRITIANIVRIIFGFLGVLFILLMLYGGWTWMTSQGQPDKINRAKKIIASAVIGLLIVLSAYSIAGFIVQSLQQAVSDGGTGGPGGPGSPFTRCMNADPGAGIVKICGLSGGATAGSVITIKGWHFETFDAANSKVFLRDAGGTETEAIPVMCSAVPSWLDRSIKAIVPTSLAPGLYTVVVQNGTTRDRCNTGASSPTPPDCLQHNILSGISPSIYCVNPDTAASDASAATDPQITITGANFGAAPGRVEMEENAGRFNVPRIDSWDPSGNEIVFRFPDNPPDPIPAITGDIIVYDAGNNPSNSSLFTVTCTSAADCGTSCCTGNQCMVCPTTGPTNPLAPVITSVNPNSGAHGNYITIRGRNFGNTQGTLNLFDLDGTQFVNPFPTVCPVNWTDTQIIFEVPAAADIGAMPRIEVTTAGATPLTSAPWTTFIVDTNVRPGLCSVTPTTQFPGLGFALTGNNFNGSGQNIFFGTPPGINATSQVFVNNTSANATVPNLTAGFSTIAMTVGGRDSNPLDFTVGGVNAGDPIINSFSPSNGPTGTYVTILGANFGNTTGRVFLRARNASGNCSIGLGNDCLADISFPPICSTDFWRDDQIIVKIPPNTPTPLPEDYYFIVERQRDARTSLPSASYFTKNTLAVRPGLCKIDPVGGPANTPVKYYGENFGTTAGSVFFFNNKIVTSTYSWSDRQVLNARVPFDAVDGPTYIRSSLATTSNGIPFRVGSCTSNAQCGSALCCSGLCRAVAQCDQVNYDENNWEFTSGDYPFDLARSTQCTEDTQSPTPFPYDHPNMNYDGFFNPPPPLPPVVLPVYAANDPVTNAPTNVVIAGRFTRPLDFDTVTGPTDADADNGIRIYQCNSASPTFNNTGCTEITGNGTFVPLGSAGFRWDLDGNADLLAETWYEVRLDDGTARSRVRALDGSTYDGSQFLGSNPFATDIDDFRWHFRTRSAAQKRCEVASITMTPAALTVPVGGTSNLMSASPVSAQCYICGGGYTYNWQITQPASPNQYADFYPPPTPPGNSTRFTGVNITPVGPPAVTAPVTATIPATSNPSGVAVTGTGALTVAYVPPHVVRHSPEESCRTVCRNVAPYATFNVNVSSATLTTGNIVVRPCADSSCALAGLGAAVPISLMPATTDPAGTRVDITPTNALAPATWYRVILSNGITNTQGQALTQLNFDGPDADTAVDSFSWTFQTSLALCEASAVNVTPVSAVIPSLGGKQTYTAHPTAVVDCGSGNVPIPINANRYTYQWSSNDFQVATWTSSSGNQGTYTGVSSLLGIPPGITQAHVDMHSKPANEPPVIAFSAEGEIVVKDSREPINLIGHRPDSGSTVSPPEFPSDGVCDLNGAPGACVNQCRNVLVSALFSTSVDPASFKSPAPTGLIARYTFDDGTARNVAGGGNNGTLSASPQDVSIVSGAQCVQNSCFDFDLGAYPTNFTSTDLVRISSFSNLPSNQISISAWINERTFTAQGQRILGHDWATTDTPGCTAGQSSPPCVYNHGWLLFAYAPGRIDFGVYGSNWGEQHVARFTNSVVSANAWHHVVGTYDGATVRVYVDGVEGTGGSLQNTPTPIALDTTGAVDFGYAYDGLMDDVQIYNRALSLTEINQIRLQGTGQAGAAGNFYVTDLSTGALVPGTISVRNYEDRSRGVCTINTNLVCSSIISCPVNDTCNYKRGRVDFTPTLSSQVSSAGLVARYSFDDGTARDLVGTNNATLQGGVTPSNTSASTPLAGSMSLNGIDGHIDMSSTNSYDYGSFTVSLWAKAGGSTPGHVTNIIGKGSWNNTDGWFIGFKSGPPAGTPATAVTFVYGLPTTPLGPWQQGPSYPLSSFDVNQWHHYVGVVTPTQESLYIDGTLRDQKTISHGSVGTGAVSIGHASYAGGLPYFNGQVDDVRIYNRALPDGEISQIRQEGLSAGVAQGTYSPGTQYRVSVCPGTSCDTNPIKSTQGVQFIGSPTFSFTTGQDMCRISFVDIMPNPAAFVNRSVECLAGDPKCRTAGSKTIIAQAKDQNGTDLLATYAWRETTEGGGTYSNTRYALNQVGDDAAVSHKGSVGTEYNQVTANGGTAGTASAQGRMDFSFCENPWIGEGTNDYYLDSTYDLRLSYCQDASGSNPSDPSGMLPSLPAPHIERSNNAGNPFNFGGDLLKEHVFIVGSGNATRSTSTSGTPIITGITGRENSYRMGDTVYMKLDGYDPEGDSFVWTMTNTDPGDQLPASASFNPRTGVFTWIVDQMPQDDDDGDGINDFEVTFSTSPVGVGTQIVTINVISGAPAPTVNRPTATFGTVTGPAGATPASISGGGTMTINYGGTVIFNASGTPVAPATIKAFIWDFQDSGLTTYTDTGAPDYSATHTFLQAGVHQVTFRVQDTANAWSLPAVVNIIVRPKTSALFEGSQATKIATVTVMPFKWFLTDVTSLFTRTAWGQTQNAAPSDVTATSIDGPNSTDPFVNIKLDWRINGAYSGIHIYRNGASIYTSPAGTAPTTYTDNNLTIGTDYVYKVCGQFGAAPEKCTEITTTARRIDYDVIVVRVYKNVGLLSIREWYEAYAPNPSGSPREVMVDGYDAIQDGTSIYVGIANCQNADTGGCANIYTNVLLLSYNAGAKPSTVETFSQLVNNIRINSQLVNRANNRGVSDTCSADTSISCVPGHDAVCQEKNAGLCTSAQAELRRDHKRIVDLHSIKSSLDAYAAQHRFCNDGTNAHACNTNADCPSGNTCVAAYPSLNSGTYVPGVTTSQWPSWDATFAKDLNSSSLPDDPINRFGANFYSNPPLNCTAFTGHDAETCWNQRALEMRCHRWSEVYAYKSSRGQSYTLYANAEGRDGWNWPNKDPRVNLYDTADPGSLGGLCRDASAVAGVCGNGVIEGSEVCDGGFINYCDSNPLGGEHNWNTETRVGCNASCTGWGVPTGGMSSCNGYCGDGSRQIPYEGCDGSVPGGTACTSGGSPYCSSSCQVSCTQGRPYSGSCGNGTVEAGEVCDDGSGVNGNGTTGRCNISCSGYGSFCGDGVLTPIDSVSKGCTCDPAAAAANFCAAGYRPVSAASCSISGCASAHQYSCVKNAEECDTVVGLTNYSCPANTSLYCDNQCNRACTTITINASGNRTSVPVYEHYYNVANDEDNDYTTLQVANTSYATKGIVFYAFSSAGAGLSPIHRCVLSPSNGNKDVRLWVSGCPGGWASQGIEFYAYTAGSPTDPTIVPVYEWYESRTGTSPLETDYKYSRSSSTIPINSAGTNYTTPTLRFWAQLGPLQETCGNDVIEGLEECEPSTYQVPTAEQATNDNRQYQCGELFTPNACRMYGGYCGDSVKNDPFEQCDEGSILPFRCTGNAAKICTSDFDCLTGEGTCKGNGAKCNNNAGNCTYCTKTCSNGLLPRNYCGDGIVNCGVDAVCGTSDDVEKCDDGGDNGKTGKCSETCSGLTGTVCGNNTIERFCSNDSLNKCTPGAEQTACTNGGGVCTGEVCDDGTNNGRWTKTCSNGSACVANGDCGAGTTGVCGAGAPRAYCSFSCLGLTVPYCGDGFVQAPNAGPDGRFVCSNDAARTCAVDGDCQAGGICNQDGVNEVCDFGSAVNGQPGQCNASCTGLAAAQCGNATIDNGRCSISNTICSTQSQCTTAQGTCVGTGTCSLAPSITCQDSSGCTAAQGTCTGVETCDPPATAVLQSCTDTSVGGKPGLRNSECTASCVSLSTQCHAFGLKIWSDGADLAYLNGHLMLLNLSSPTSTQCIDDTQANGADYADTIAESPAQPNSNKCVP